MDTIYSTHPQPVLESRLDWLTCTIKAGKRQDVIHGRVARWQQERKDLGYREKAFVTPFYKGSIVGGVTWGERQDDALLNLSGEAAGKWGATAITWADGVSRLDVQVTLLDHDLTHEWASYVDRLAGLLPEVKSEQLTTRFIRSRPNGSTAYIGDGGSDRMLRVYNKHDESKGDYPVGSWRWEVQYRHALALSVARKLLDGTYLPQTCFNAVCVAFERYKIAVPSLCLLSGWKDAGIRRKTDDDKRLEWLRRSVAPAVEKLRYAHPTDEVLDALGLNDIIDTLESQSAALDQYATMLADLAPGLDHRTNQLEVPLQ